MKDKSKAIIWATPEIEYGADYASTDSKIVTVLGDWHVPFPRCKDCGRNVYRSTILVHDEIELHPCQKCAEARSRMKGICEE